MKEIRSIIQFYKTHCGSGQQMVLATVVNVEDSSYRRIGARMLILENGQWIGGISGGCLEGDALLQAKKVMISGESRVATYDTRDRDAQQIGVGLGCEGRIEVYLQLVSDELMDVLAQCLSLRKRRMLVTPVVENSSGELPYFTDGEGRSRLVEEGSQKNLCEWIEPNVRVVIIGDNYDIYPLLDICRTMGWEITLAGRQRKLKKEGMEGLAEVISPDNLDMVSVDAFTAVLSMSHDYEMDKKVFSRFFPKKPGYLGLLGPRKRFDRMIEELGLEEKTVAAVHNPMGLHLGAVTPEEIAVAVVAEVVRVFRGGDGRSLKEKEGPIHD